MAPHVRVAAILGGVLLVALIAGAAYLGYHSRLDEVLPVATVGLVTGGLSLLGAAIAQKIKDKS